MPQLLDATDIPPYVIMSSSDLFLNASFSGSLGLVGGVEMVSRFGSLVEGSVAHHGVEGSQESSGHGDIGFGVSSAADETLPDFLLSSVVLTQGDGGLAQGPAQSGRAGLGDGSRLRSTGGFLEVGGQPGPEFQGVGIGEAVERTNFGGNDATPDIADAGHALEEGHLGGTLFAVGSNDVSTELFALPFDEQNDIEVVAEGVSLHLFEQATMGQQPSLGGGAVEFGSADIGGVEQRLHALLGACESSAETSPVSAEFAQGHQVIVGDEAERTVAACEPAGNVEGVVVVALASFSPAQGQLGGVGNVGAIHAVAESVDEPLGEADRFDRHPARFGQGSEPVFDFADTFGVDLETSDGLAVRIDSTEGDGALMQIHAHKRSVRGGDLLGTLWQTVLVTFFAAHFRNLRVRGQRYQTRRFGRHCKAFHRPLHGFTLIELLVVITISGLLVAILVPGLAGAREQARGVKCLSHLRQYGAANMEYADYDPLGRVVWQAWVQTPKYLQLLGLSDAEIERMVSSEWRLTPFPESHICPSSTVANLRVTDSNGDGWPDAGMPATYGYNDSMLRYDPRPWYSADRQDAYCEFFRLSNIPMPSKKIMFLDAADTAVNTRKDRYTDLSCGINYALHWDRWGDIYGPDVEGNVHVGVVSYRHREGSNVVFYDGHAEYLKKERLWYVDDQGRSDNGAMKLHWYLRVTSRPEDFAPFEEGEEFWLPQVAGD